MMGQQSGAGGLLADGMSDRGLVTGAVYIIEPQGCCTGWTGGTIHDRGRRTILTGYCGCIGRGQLMTGEDLLC